MHASRLLLACIGIVVYWASPIRTGVPGAAACAPCALLESKEEIHKRSQGQCASERAEESGASTIVAS